MKNLFCSAAILSFISLTISCGSAVDSSAGEDLVNRSFEPIAAYTQAKKLAEGYTNGVTAFSLSGTQKSRAPVKSPASFTWIWTLVGQDGTFVDVEVSPAGATVLDHERRALSDAQVTFEPSKVSVTGADVLAIAAQQKPGQPTDLYLGARLLASGATALRWSVGFSGGELALDGDTGDRVN